MNGAIDLLKHLLAIFVIVQHMHSGTRYSEHTNQILSSACDWLDGAVIGFFLISGFLYKSPADLKAYGYRQAKRLLVPYFVFSTLYAALLGLAGKGDFEGLLYATVAFQGASMQLYFLPYLAGITVLFATFERLLVWRRSTALLALCSLLLATYSQTDASTGSDLELLPLYFYTFALGAVMRKEQPSLRVVGFAITLLTVGIGLIDKRMLDLALMLALLYGAVIYGRQLSLPRIGGSGGVYLLHTPFVNFGVSSVLERLGVSQVPNVVLSVVLTYVFCLAATRIFVSWFPAASGLLLE